MLTVRRSLSRAARLRFVCESKRRAARFFGALMCKCWRWCWLMMMVLVRVMVRVTVTRREACWRCSQSACFS